MREDKVNRLIVKNRGTLPYQQCLDEMRDFTLARTEETTDEIWLVGHPAVYSQGLAGKPEHILTANTSIPIVQSDRGGQVTYHGPGQLILYPLLNIKRLNINIKQLVRKLEHTIIALLKEIGIEANSNDKAPGVYVGDKKIASVGLRIKKGCCYHGIALNVAMSLQPFNNINPCGYKGLKMCQIIDFKPEITLQDVQVKIINAFISEFRYTSNFSEITTST